MIFSEPTMLCDLQEQQSCEAGSLCSVLFEAPSLPVLGLQLAHWLQTRPGYAPVAFSHAHETRWELGTSLAGPRACSLYTGLLLLRVLALGNAERGGTQSR